MIPAGNLRIKTSSGKSNNNLDEPELFSDIYSLVYSFIFLASISGLVAY